MTSSGLKGWAKRLHESMRETFARDTGPLPSIPRYEILGRIGEGAMAVVFRARDRELDRAVALKVLKESLGSADAGRRRFAREAQAIAQISHPNVVTVHDAGEAEGRPYLAMELVDGRPLSDVLGERKLESGPLVRILEKAARGVAAAHARAIVHRDLKPANILVSREGEPKVVDFGVAHLGGDETQLTKSGSIIGTPLYMSPEQAAGRTRDIGPATDVYALGAILYEILTGRPPHTGESVTEIYGRIIGEEPPSPRRLNTQISRDLEAVTLKAIDKEPARRYADAAGFADDLRRWIDGEAVRAQPPSLATQGRRWVRRHRVASAVMTTVAVALLIGAGILLAGLRSRLREVALHLEQGRLAEEEVARLRRGADGPETRERLKTRETELVDAYTRALALDRGNREANEALAGFYLAELERAEGRGDGEAATSALRMALLFGGRPATEGTISMDSDPPGAAIELFRFEPGGDGRLLPRSLGPAARAPLPERALPIGSYLAVLRADGRRDTRHPIQVGRGSRVEAKVRLFSDAEIGAGFIHVPAGPFIAGDGDDRRREETGDFFIAIHEVTAGEYLEFLNAVSEGGGHERAQRHVPRTAVREGYYFTLRPGTGRIVMPDWFNPRMPANGISWEDAVAFAEWRTEASRSRGERVTWRLPTSLEWEKAARGADGRAFPWGDRFDPSFCNGAIGVAKPALAPVDSHPGDESPYGVRGMAGGVFELCGDGIEEQATGFKAARGGAWNEGVDRLFRTFQKKGASPVSVDATMGFRLLKVPAP